MALIPGTLPNDTCYGTPQDLLELFAQYLDVPAFALSSKVVFSTTNTGFTSDIVWFDTGSALPASATRPIMKITVSALGFTDYVQNYITAAPSVTIVGADTLLIVDATDGNTKRGLVSDIVPAAGSVTPAQLSQPFTSGTAVASTSGTAIDFTGIPSWVKRITVIFSGVSLNGSSYFLIQAGAGSVTTSGYSGIGVKTNSSATVQEVSTEGFSIRNGASSSYITRAHIVLTLVSSNVWVSSHSGSTTDGSDPCAVTGGGSISLSGTLDRVRITTVNGADTFDAGSINIMYE